MSKYPQYGREASICEYRLRQLRKWIAYIVLERDDWPDERLNEAVREIRELREKLG